MIQSPHDKPLPGSDFLPALPIDSGLWHTVARSLRLSPRHTRIVELVLRGMDDDDIKATLGISYSTLRTHFDRIGVRTGAQGRNAIFRLVLKVSHQVKK